MFSSAGSLTSVFRSCACSASPRLALRTRRGPSSRRPSWSRTWSFWHRARALARWSWRASARKRCAATWAFQRGKWGEWWWGVDTRSPPLFPSVTKTPPWKWRSPLDLTLVLLLSRCNGIGKVVFDGRFGKAFWFLSCFFERTLPLFRRENRDSRVYFGFSFSVWYMISKRIPFEFLAQCRRK